MVDAGNRTDRPPVEGFLEAFRGVRKALLLPHDNPDPDGLAGAFALRHLLIVHGIDAVVAFGGMIGRAENRAMVRTLGLDPTPLSTLDVAEFDAVALIDTQPGTGNNPVTADAAIRAVIDHHPLLAPLDNVSFVDIRPEYGATATIVTEYARDAGVELPTDIATALFYAIRSETQDLGREASPADREAYVELLMQADMSAVARIQRARVPREYFGTYLTAIRGARVHGHVVMTDLGVVSSADHVAEIADFLLRLREVTWSACIGRHRHTLAVSIRTTDPFAHAGYAIRQAIEGLGTAGGHGTMAGGQVPVSDDSAEEIAEEVKRRLLTELGAEPGEGEPLAQD